MFAISTPNRSSGVSTFEVLHLAHAKSPTPNACRVFRPRVVLARALDVSSPTSTSFPLDTTRADEPALERLVTTDTIKELESTLDNGASVAALRRFNGLLAALPEDCWEEKLAPVMNELAYNLESFNPAFAAVVLRVQCTVGKTDYVRRDTALKNLIQPLAGEYGMHNGEEQARTHRELFSIFYADLMKKPLEGVLAANPEPHHGKVLFDQMMRDLSAPEGVNGPVELASYTLGYNLAIEYLADYEKTWMLDSFRELNERVLKPQGRPLTEWLFLEVHAEGEAEHAALGHTAVASLVPASHEYLLERAMRDHDRDFSAFYNRMADLLE